VGNRIRHYPGWQYLRKNHGLFHLRWHSCTVYDDTSPTPITLVGESTVFGTNTAQNIDDPIVNSLEVKGGGKIVSATANEISIFAGPIEGARYTEASGQVIRADSIDAGIVASPTQTQGSGLLLSSFNEISVVSTPNDTVTLANGIIGTIQEVINNGTNPLQIFPNVGTQIELSPIDAPVTLPIGGRVQYRLVSPTKWLLLNDALGDIPFLPSDKPNLVQWNRFNQGITITGSGASQWDDQSGQANHLLQTVDSQRLTVLGDGALLSDGISQDMQTLGYTLNQPTTVYLKIKQVSSISGGRLIDGIGGNSGGLFQATSPQLNIYAGAQLGPMTDLLVGVFGSVAIVFNGANSSVQHNGNTPITGNAGTNSMSGVTIGSFGGTSNWSNTEYREIIVYAAAHTPTDIAEVNAYMQPIGN